MKKTERRLAKSLRRVVKECGVTFTLNQSGHIKATSATPKTKGCRSSIAASNRQYAQINRVSRKARRRRFYTKAFI